MEPAATWIARNARIGGRIETEGSVRVDGRIEGSIRAGEVVTVGPGSMAVAEIVARRAEIWGTVIGNVIATDRIQVLAGARVVGDLRAPDIELASGAIVEGRVDREGSRQAEGADPRQTVRARGLRRPTRPPGSPNELAASAVAAGAARSTQPSPPRPPPTPAPGVDDEPTLTHAPPPPPRPPRLSSRARLIPRKRTKGEP